MGSKETEKEWVVELPVECKASSDLEKHLNIGPLSERRGKLIPILEAEQVARFSGFKIEIFSREHAPPHFRVLYRNMIANYRIKDCKPLAGNQKLSKYDNNVKEWWKDNKGILIATWNRLRPSDCPVGKYRED